MNKQQNVLLMIADDHRTDAIRALGNSAVRTPNLDRLAQNGTAFTHAFTTIPICTPARAELLTGCNAFRNGVRFFGEGIKPGLTLLPQALADAGYTTFFTGKWHNDATPDQRGFGITRRVFNRGMGPHEMTFKEDGRQIKGFSSELFAEAAVDFLRGRPRSPWFAYVSFTAPHDPRTPPDGWRYNPADIPLPPNYMPEHPFDNGHMTGRDEQLEGWPRTQAAVKAHLADYYGMISHLDEQVGRVLQALEDNGQAQDTLVIYTGDHGLAIGSHGLMGKQNLYDHSVRVPLLLRGPGIPQNRQSGALCHDYDLYPTICERAGVSVPATVEGRSLTPVLTGGAEEHRDQVNGAFRDVMRMIRTRRWKLIGYPHLDRFQLFDLDNDPHELRDLLLPWRYRTSPRDERYELPMNFEEVQQIAGELRDRLIEWQKAVGDPLTDALQ